MRRRQGIVPRLQMLSPALTLVTVLLLCSMPARTSDQTLTSYTIGVENITHLPYYGMCGASYCGYARDLLDAFARDEGLNVHFRSLPIPRLHRALVGGEIDAKFPAHPTWANDAKEGAPILYSDPVITFTDGYLSLPSGTGLPMKVGTMRGFTLDFSTQKWSPQIFEANAETDLFRLLQRGRVDAIYTNIGVMTDFLLREKINGNSVVFRRDLPYRRSQYFLSTATDPLLVSRFNAWMARSSDKLLALQQRYNISPID